MKILKTKLKEYPLSSVLFTDDSLFENSTIISINDICENRISIEFMYNSKKIISIINKSNIDELIEILKRFK